MRPHSTLLSKTCPVCGARAIAEAKLPIPANTPKAEFNLDEIGSLVEKQSLSLLLALVELLPYKTFVCAKCGAEFRLENRSVKDMVHSMLTSMRPILPQARPGKPAPRRRAPARTQPKVPAAPSPTQGGKDWESESLDALFDYSVDPDKTNH
jgi:predicted RNA-binding Zn-ribbon protein involved in translation (DUF1610 family)